jgi:hypothetical protein
MSREAMRMALEALELYLTMDTVEESHLLEVDIAPKAITALRAALAEPEPRNQCGETCEGEEHMTREDIDELMRDNGISVVGEAVYALCQIVAAHEREACANLLLNVDLISMDADRRLQSWTATVLLNFSAAIRARGEQ